MTELRIEQTEEQEYEPLPLDQVYVVEVQGYEIVKSRYKDKSGNPREDIQWRLVVIEPEQYAGRVFLFWLPSRLYRHKLTGEPNKSLRFLEYLGLPPEAKETGKVNLDDFIGKRIQVTIVNKIGREGRTYQKIKDFFPYTLQKNEQKV